MKAITKFSQLDLNKRYSYADYLTWQFQERVELIKGWVHKMSPAPNVTHQKVSWNITSRFAPYFKNEPCKIFYAPFDVRLPDSKKTRADELVYSVVQPDICVICDEKKLDEQGCIGAPDWIIEILSPGNSRREMQTKFELYEENGVLDYWVVNPLDESIMVFILAGKKYQYQKTYFSGDKITSRLFKCLVMDVTAVFKK
jgi:Uma2 family endonuclease